MGRVRTGVLVGLGALAAAGTLWLYAPALSLELTGDDYQWVQHAGRALQRPWLLLADVGGFYRPLGTATLVGDHLLWPQAPGGYHATNLLLHLLAAALLGVAAGRLGLAPPLCLAVGTLWAVSPWTSESAVHIAVRFESLLMAAWAALVAAWPRAEEAWTPWRRAGAAAAVAAAALSKETWVVTPALVGLLAAVQRRQGGWRAWLPAALTGALVVVYVAAHTALLQVGRPYFAWGWQVLAKLPQLVGAFVLLQAPQVAEFRLTLAGVVGAAALGAAAVAAWRSRRADLALGVGLLILPALPTLATPVLPLRYGAIAWGGFLLLLASLGAHLLARSPRRWRRPAAVALVVAALALGGWGAIRVRGELEDARRISRAHARLLEQLRVAAGEFPVGVPVVLVSAPEPSPVAAVVAAPAGWPKLAFVRGDDPAGLADSAALLEWVLRPRGLQVEHVADWGGPQGRRPGRVLRYAQAEGFSWLRAPVQEAGRWAAHWRAQGFGVRLLEAHPRDGAPR